MEVSLQQLALLIAIGSIGGLTSALQSAYSVMSSSNRLRLNIFKYILADAVVGALSSTVGIILILSGLLGIESSNLYTLLSLSFIFGYSGPHLILRISSSLTNEFLEKSEKGGLHERN